MIAVLDTAAVSSLAPTDERGRARLRALRRQADHLVLPAAVLTEGVLSGHPGRDHHVRRLLQLVTVAPVGEDLGFAAGALRRAALAQGADPAPSGVDAAVAAVADDRASGQEVVIVTSDPDDLASLAAHARHPERLSILPI